MEKIASWWCRHFHTHCHSRGGHCWLCGRGPVCVIKIEGQDTEYVIDKNEHDKIASSMNI